MTKKSLSDRDPVWVKKARETGETGEISLQQCLEKFLPEMEIISKPKTLKKIYGGKFGIIPDLCIKNKSNGKMIFLEKKTGEKGGNAHERAYKYLSPALIQKVQEDFNVTHPPFLFVFSGKTFKDEKYTKEISFMLSHIPDNFIIWDGSDEMIENFSIKIRKKLQS